MIVVSADCLEARRLKKAITEISNIRNIEETFASDNYNDKYNEKKDNDFLSNLKEVNVIWGRPEIPKLFSTMH